MVTWLLPEHTAQHHLLVYLLYRVPLPLVKSLSSREMERPKPSTTTTTPAAVGHHAGPSVQQPKAAAAVMAPVVERCGGPVHKYVPGMFNCYSNSSNNCWMNAVLQCLHHVPAARQLILQDCFGDATPNAIELHKLLRRFEKAEQQTARSKQQRM